MSVLTSQTYLSFSRNNINIPVNYLKGNTGVWFLFSYQKLSIVQHYIQQFSWLSLGKKKVLSLSSLNLYQQSTMTHSCFSMGNADGILSYLQDYNVCQANLNSIFHKQWQVWSSLHSNSNGDRPQGCMAPINSLSIQEHMCGNICATVSPSLQPYFSFHESLQL